MEHFRLRFLYQHVAIYRKKFLGINFFFFFFCFHLEVMADFVMFSTEAICVYQIYIN